MEKIFDQIKTAINQANNILLTLHPSPDGDSVGSNLALFHYLKSIGKTVVLIKGDSKIPSYLSALPGFQNIVDQNILDININSFDLLIVLDASSISQITKFENFTFPQSLQVINIDHHTSNTKFGSINCINNLVPATSQLIAEFIYQNKKEFTYNEAACLLLGLHTDTGGYKYPPTSTTTFFMASKLAQACQDYHKYIYEIENNDNLERLKLVGYLLSHIETYFHNRIAISSVSYQQFKKININPEEFGSIEVANQIKAVVGWEIGITLMEISKNKVKVSLRKRLNNFDVSKIAVNSGFGGGHTAAAGATFPYPLLKAKRYLLKIIQQTYPELGEI